MIARGQQGQGLAVSPETETVFAQRAMAQYLACLAKAGNVEALEKLACAPGVVGKEPWFRLYVAVGLASAGRIDESIACLRELPVAEANQREVRNLAYRLLMRKARLKAKVQDWGGLTAAIAEANAVAPAGANPQIELGSFKHALPIGHLRSGNRQEAAKLWEDELRNNPAEIKLLHHLALLHYWWAHPLPVAEVMPQWRTAIAYWSVLGESASFWANWGEVRCKAWGIQFPSADLDFVRTQVVESRLRHFFQTRADEHTQKRETNDAANYDQLITAARLEERSASCWKAALANLTPDKSRPPLLNLPGGVLFFERFGLLPEIAACIERLPKNSANRNLRADLKVLFSEFNLGFILVLAESGNRSDEAIRLLDDIKRVNLSLPEVQYVRVIALARKGTDFYGRGDTAAALAAWKQAYDLARKKRSEGASEFEAPLEALQSSIVEQHVEAVKKEAARLNREDKTDQAISFLQSARHIDLDEELAEIQCVYLCDSADESLRKENFAKAREKLNQVLKLKSGYPRAKQMLSMVCNNEGCKEADHDRAITLFEKALEWDSDSHMAKRNLASELKSKAVDIFNALPERLIRTGCDAPLNLLERAAGLFAHELSADACKIIEQSAKAGTTTIHQTIKNDADFDDMLKGILVDMATIYHARYRARGY